MITILLAVVIAAPVTLTDADLVPGALVTVWQDDTGRHVVVQALPPEDDNQPIVSDDF